MNARNRLIAHLQQAGLSTARAEANLDAYAHELAEQQRTFLRSKGTVWTGSIGQVIDHIDPEAQR
ncbi:hypothetical protein [Streptomyces sp. NPDC047990]|uniref:hypothetical protein n=1 Tax=Streptomyces sp. NPDC047990 TaxID=3365496 RepID=UPI0037182FE1